MILKTRCTYKALYSEMWSDSRKI